MLSDNIKLFLFIFNLPGYGEAGSNQRLASFGTRWNVAQRLVEALAELYREAG